MAFVIETIPDEERAKWLSDDFIRRFDIYGGSNSHAKKWAIDHQRDAWIIRVQNTMPEVPPIDKMIMKLSDEFIRFDTVIIAPYTPNTDQKKLDQNWAIKVYYPLESKYSQEEINRFIEEGVTVMGTPSCNPQVVETLTINFKDSLHDILRGK